jgi:hypothetical protein
MRFAVPSTFAGFGTISDPWFISRAQGGANPLKDGSGPWEVFSTPDVPGTRPFEASRPKRGRFLFRDLSPPVPLDQTNRRVVRSDFGFGGLLPPSNRCGLRDCYVTGAHPCSLGFLDLSGFPFVAADRTFARSSSPTDCCSPPPFGGLIKTAGFRGLCSLRPGVSLSECANPYDLRHQFLGATSDGPRPWVTSYLARRVSRVNNCCEISETCGIPAWNQRCRSWCVE